MCKINYLNKDIILIMENLELEVEAPVTASNSTDDNRVARPIFRAQYDNFIGGKWIAPVKGQYFDNP